MVHKIKSVWFYDEEYKENILFVIGDSIEFQKYVFKECHIKLLNI